MGAQKKGWKVFIGTEQKFSMALENRPTQATYKKCRTRIAGSQVTAFQGLVLNRESYQEMMAEEEGFSAC